MQNLTKEQAKFIRSVASAEINAVIDRLRENRQLTVDQYHHFKDALYILDAFNYDGSISDCPPQSDYSYSWPRKK